jgi:hypothetical protein
LGFLVDSIKNDKALQANANIVVFITIIAYGFGSRTGNKQSTTKMIITGFRMSPYLFRSIPKAHHIPSRPNGISASGISNNSLSETMASE